VNGNRCVEGKLIVFIFHRWMWLALTVVLGLLTLGCRGEQRPGASNGASADTDAATKSKSSKDEPATVEPLKLLVVDDPELARAIAGQWQAMTGAKLDLVEQTSGELEQTPGALAADIVIYPTALLGTLVERDQIVPLSDEVANGTALRRRDQLEMTRLHETVWGETTYAVPLGSRQFLLYYRKDLLDKIGAEPPKTWSEYQSLAERLADRSLLGDSQPTTTQPWFATAEPLGPGWGGAVLLARAAAYAKHRSQYSTIFDFTTLEPRLAAPPFVRALEELVAAAKLGSPDAGTMSPDAARQAVLAGRCALALSWPSPRRETVEPKDSTGEEKEAGGELPVDESILGKIGVARVPGSVDVYNFGESRWERRGAGEPRHVTLLGVSGRLGSVTKSSRRTTAAFNFLAMLSNAEWHPRVLTASRGAGMFRNSHVDSAATWFDASLSSSTAGEFGRLTQQIHREDGWLFIPRVPGRGEYLVALDEAVAAAVAGTASPAAALQQAAERWEKLTDERGRDAQRRAYRRCLGLEK